VTPNPQAPIFSFDDSFMKNLLSTLNESSDPPPLSDSDDDHNEININDDERIESSENSASEDDTHISGDGNRSRSSSDSRSNDSESSIIEEKKKFTKVGEILLDNSSNKKSTRSSSVEMKNGAFVKPFMQVTKLLNQPCNEKCKLNRECTKLCTLQDIYELRNEFWGEECSSAPLDSERAERLLKYFRKCSRKDESGNLQFKCGSSYVCECAFLRLLGLMIGNTLAFAPQMYTRLKAGYLGNQITYYLSFEFMI